MPQAQAKNPEVVEGVEVESAGVLATLSKAEIDIQITTAKRYPRSIVAFKQQALELATLDEQTAKSMFYTVPRSGKHIEGPSVRLAEIVGSSWGNLKYAARVVDIDAHFVTAQGMAFDMEKNVPCTIEVRRRITDKYNRRYSDDMIMMTANAAMSIALRNAIFKVVPFALVKGIYEKAKETSLGKSLTMPQRRKNAIEALGQLGAKQADILRVLNRKGMDDITIEDLIKLHGIHTAITEGDTTWDDILADLPKTDADIEGHLRTKLDDVADSIPANEPPKQQAKVRLKKDKEPESVIPEAEPEPTPPSERMLTAAEIEDLQYRYSGKQIDKALEEFGLSKIADLKITDIPMFEQAMRLSSREAD